MKKLNGPLSVKFINRHFFNDYKDVSVINMGECFLWAYIAYSLYDRVQLWDMGSHAFVRYQGKFYDSEVPDGVSDWRDLPACNFGEGCGCQACKKPAGPRAPATFHDNWASSAARHRVDWKKVDRKVQRIIGIHNP